MKQLPEITPRIKVGELLEAYPHLMEILTSCSPAFARLKNPVLFRTVARISTLQQVAVVGGVKLDELVNRLREAAGQDRLNISEDGQDLSLPPGWLDEHPVTHNYDATPLINRGDSPLADILRMAAQLEKSSVLCIHTPFIPAPVIAALKEKGFTVYTGTGNGYVSTYVTP